MLWAYAGGPPKQVLALGTRPEPEKLVLLMQRAPSDCPECEQRRKRAVTTAESICSVNAAKVRSAPSEETNGAKMKILT